MDLKNFNPFCIVTILVTYVKEQCLFFLRDTKFVLNSIFFIFMLQKVSFCHFVKTHHFILHHPAVLLTNKRGHIGTHNSEKE